MPFDLCNAPVTFQHLMDKVLYNVIYIYDIIIYSQFLDDHSCHLKKVFQLLAKAELKLNLDKCNFYKDQILFLGYLVFKKGIEPNFILVEKIKTCPAPNIKRKVKSFLDLASYNQHFIKNFSKITKPLYKLTFAR